MWAVLWALPVAARRERYGMKLCVHRPQVLRVPGVDERPRPLAHDLEE